MILFELTGRSEDHPAYRALHVSNGERHYGFLQSLVAAALSIDRPFLSQTVIKAINYHAIACLHTDAGKYRPCPVEVGDYQPPEHCRVDALMDDFVNIVNRNMSMLSNKSTKWNRGAVGKSIWPRCKTSCGDS